MKGGVTEDVDQVRQGGGQDGFVDNRSEGGSPRSHIDEYAYEDENGKISN